MATTLKFLDDQSVSTLLSTALNSLPNNVAATGSVFTNNQYLMGNVEAKVYFAAAPAASTALSVWLLQNIGQGYEDGSSGVTPVRLPDVVLPLRAVTTEQNVIVPCLLPPGNFIPLLKNDGTGQTIASGFLYIRPFTYTNV